MPLLFILAIFWPVLACNMPQHSDVYILSILIMYAIFIANISSESVFNQYWYFIGSAVDFGYLGHCLIGANVYKFTSDNWFSHFMGINFTTTELSQLIGICCASDECNIEELLGSIITYNNSFAIRGALFLKHLYSWICLLSLKIKQDDRLLYKFLCFI